MKIQKVGIIGLGYVGLPLAIAVSKRYKTYGFDSNLNRINELKRGIDKTKEVKKKNFFKNENLIFVKDINFLNGCDIFIIAVPTPINSNKKPYIKALISATGLVSKIIKRGSIVVYESTVYPGLTREKCLPIIEKNSKLKLNKDFWIGYSPERINPGDKKKTIYNIKKVTSGSNKFSANIIDKFYKSIIPAGTYLAESIEVAEAAKVIENTQRDINIALINELSMIFNKLNISTKSVLEAASSKWNFLNFFPGLVGGHCIGVDPYYLAQKAKEKKIYPKIILAGRKINDNMYKFIFKNIKRIIRQKYRTKKKFNAIIFGSTFKDNCPDMRNSKIIDLFNILNQNNIKTFFYDPIADIGNKDKIKLNFIDKPKKNFYDIMIVANNHNNFQKYFKNFSKILKKKYIIVDLKNALPREKIDFSL